MVPQMSPRPSFSRASIIGTEGRREGPSFRAASGAAFPIRSRFRFHGGGTIRLRRTSWGWRARSPLGRPLGLLPGHMQQALCGGGLATAMPESRTRGGRLGGARGHAMHG
jgi:hypothetical protein